MEIQKVKEIIAGATDELLAELGLQRVDTGGVHTNDTQRQCMTNHAGQNGYCDASGAWHAYLP